MAEEKKLPRHEISLRGKLFLYFFVFILFSLTVIWFLQIRLVGTFYGNIKRNELGRVANAIEEHINDEQEYFGNIVYQNAVNHGVCVRVMKLHGTTAVEYVSYDIAENCVLHHMTDEYFSKLYSKALHGGGEYSEQKTLASLEQAGAYYPQFTFSPNKELQSSKNDKSMIHVRIIENEAGEEFIIMLNAEMTPMNAVTQMLSLQFLWVATTLLVGAVVLAFIVAKNISRPIETMNRSAKRLAQGNYDVDFSGRGFKETRELGDTLNYAAKELSKSDRLQKELIANISHDLRTPLTMITGYSEVMRDIPGENTPENMQVIIDEANRLSELVGDLLDLSRLQAGASDLNIERFNLTETLRETMERYRKLVGKDGYRIEFEADEDISINGDRKMLLQVLYNLINNAINYTGTDKLVKVSQTVVDGAVRISVSDSGEGIPADQLPLIWDRYYKVDKVHRRARVGTGIGLSIVKNVLELHSAAYGVDSTVGKGSTFWFEIKNNEKQV